MYNTAVINILRLSVIVLYSLAQTKVTMARLQAVNWTTDGVEKEQYKVTVKAGDMLTFMCPKGAYSTIWFIEHGEQYDNCNCDSSCIYASSCLYFEPSNYTTTIKSISEPLQNTPDYRPGNTYYFASFSEDFSTLHNPRGSRSGGECIDMLKLTVEVLSDNETEDVSDVDYEDTTNTDPGSGSDDDGKPTDEDIKEDTLPTVEALSSSSSPFTFTSSVSLILSLTMFIYIATVYLPIHS